MLERHNLMFVWDVGFNLKWVKRIKKCITFTCNFYTCPCWLCQWSMCLWNPRVNMFLEWRWSLCWPHPMFILLWSTLCIDLSWSEGDHFVDYTLCLSFFGAPFILTFLGGGCIKAVSCKTSYQNYSLICTFIFFFDKNMHLHFFFTKICTFML